MRVAAILGILVGIPAGLFGIPAAVDVFFGETDVAPGAVWRGDGLAISVESVVVGEGPRRAATVVLRVRVEEARTIESEGVELELADGARVPLGPDGLEPPRLDAGADETIALTFPLPDGGAAPRVLRLPDPGVRFELGEAEP